MYELAFSLKVVIIKIDAITWESINITRQMRRSALQSMIERSFKISSKVCPRSKLRKEFVTQLE